ncbi:PCDG2 protein, partial [Eudromia elegans]|nr:PCDG2 protein [Eudromia elegans]
MVGGTLLWCALLSSWEVTWGQLRYSVPEEMQKGSFVGDVAKDLGLQLSALRDRGARVVSEGRRQYFSLHEKTGYLVTAERIDREEVCGRVQTCMLNLEILEEFSMRIFKVKIEITDLNDNAPKFRQEKFEFQLSETAAVGTRFPLEEAQDADMGLNALQRYELSGDEHFALDVQTGPDGSRYAELVLAKPLDREEAAFHELVLTAVDGGDPARTGTARIRVVVLDANDNAPVFSQAVYTVRVREDVPVGFILITVNATDADEGTNANVTYSFRKLPARQLRLVSAARRQLKYFSVSADSGELYVSERLDREEMCGDSASCSVSFEAVVQNPLNVFQVDVDIRDINDNSPVFSKAALDLEIGEWIVSGARFPLEMAQDADVGSNSLLSYQLTENPSFRLELKETPVGKKLPELVLEGALDREKQSSFEMVLTAVDGGSPSRSGTVQIRINVTDANDNAPVFSKSAYEARVRENVATGSLVLQVRATDADAGSNGRVSY